MGNVTLFLCKLVSKKMLKAINFFITIYMFKVFHHHFYYVFLKQIPMREYSTIKHFLTVEDSKV